MMAAFIVCVCDLYTWQSQMEMRYSAHSSVELLHSKCCIAELLLRINVWFVGAQISDMRIQSTYEA